MRTPDAIRSNDAPRFVSPRNEGLRVPPLWRGGHYPRREVTWRPDGSRPRTTAIRFLSQPTPKTMAADLRRVRRRPRAARSVRTAGRPVLLVAHRTAWQPDCR